MTKAETDALNAIKFCLINGRQPFRVDLEIIVRLIDRLGLDTGEGTRMIQPRLIGVDGPSGSTIR